MNLNYEILNTFYWVYSTRNITKAAEILYISQPAVSKSIKKMEEILDLDLFVRTKRGVIPTKDAKSIFEYLKPAIECINNSEQKFLNITSLQEGNINIGCGTTLAQTVLLPALEKFSENYPNISINIERAQTHKLLKKLEFGILDIVIANMPLVDEYPNIKLFKSIQINDCFFVSKTYPNLKNTTIALNELNNYPLILQHKTSHTRTFLDNFCKENNIVLEAKYELESASLIKDFALRNLGIGYLPQSSIINTLDFDKLTILNLDVTIPSRDVGIFVKSNSMNDIRCKKFISYI